MDTMEFRERVVECLERMVQALDSGHTDSWVARAFVDDLRRAHEDDKKRMTENTG